MLGFLKRIGNAFERANELDRISREYSDLEERHEALLAVIHGPHAGRTAQATCQSHRFRQDLAA